MGTSLTLLAETLNANPQQRLEFLVNASPMVLFTCEATGDFHPTFVSEGVRTLWGYEPEEFLNARRFWASHVHPEDAERFQNNIICLLETGRHSQEYRFRAKSGEYRWTHDELRLVRDSAGNPREIIGHCVDITERKRAESALRENEDRLALVFNSTSDLQVLFRVEPNHRFVTETVNRALIENFKASTGKDVSDFVGGDFEGLLAATGLTAQEIESRRFAYRKAVEEKVPIRLESPYSPIRDAVEIEVSPVVDQNGDCTHLFWNARKVTERVKAEAALRESEERYALVTQATHDGIFDWNLVTGDSYLSPRFKEILGYRDDELPNDASSFFGRVHPDDVAWLNELVARMHADRTIEMFEHEVRLQCKDGGYRWAVSRGQVVRNPKGQPTRFVGSIHDITERKRVEDALAFLASIVQSSDDSIVGSDQEGTILSWNAGSERFWGYTAEEVIGKHVSILFPRERLEEYTNGIERIKRNQPIERFEALRVRKDGTPVAVSVILSPIKDPRGKLLGVSAIYHDITKRKETDAQFLVAQQAAEASAAALRESEERYALVTQATRDGIYDWNLVTRISYHSPRFKEILGYRDDELPNDPSSFFDRVHPEDSPRLSGMVARHTQDKTVDAFDDEVRLRCKDGSYHWVSSRGRLVRDAEGNITRVVGAIRDITERMEAAAKLAGSEKRLRDILDSLYGFVVLLTLDGTLIDVNRAPLEATGIQAEDVVGKPFWESYWWNYSPQEQARLRRMMVRAARGEVVRYEASALTKGGRQIIVDVTFGPLRDQQGGITSVIGFGVDITARKEAETKLLLAKQMAEVASRAKSEFLANMSHEIRTPMNGIIGLTEVVLDSPLNPEQREYLSLVKTSADSLMKIIGDILDISKIQAGKLVLQPKEFWLRDLVDNTINGFTNAADEKNLKLICHIQPEIPDVLLGDPVCLKQVLMNLLGNAIKFTAAGEVMISVETAPGNSDQLRFSVRDTGIGIAPDKQQMIFEPFSQVDGSSRREFGGTGLGLAISAQLVEMMGGDIWVVSDGHSGSTFHFTARLPAVVTSAEAASESAKEPNAAQGIVRNHPLAKGRRRVPRFAANDTATLKLLRPFSPVEFAARVLSVSGAGLQLGVDQALDAGMLVQIQIKNDIAVAEVRYCVPGSQEFHIGVQLADTVQ